MIDALKTLRQSALTRIASCSSTDALQLEKSKITGKKGELTELLKQLKSLPNDQKREVGKEAHSVKAALEQAFEARRIEIIDNVSPLGEHFDVTRPGTGALKGGLHPITQMAYDLNDAFASLGFEVFDGPEITSELYEFDSLNFPEDHPARESMDTYWLDNAEGDEGAKRLCLRPHLTGASVRYMQTHEPPFRFVYPGRVYRNEATDARHERAFFQYEALIVDKEVPFSSGKLLVKTILEKVFGRDVEVRMRAGFFPFVEPGFEIDMRCLCCNGKGCKVCSGVGWLEVMPGGPPHPNVLKSGGIDPQEWTGYYLNVGLDRLVMMRYGIDDVRLFHSGDLRFLTQFK